MDFVKDSQWKGPTIYIHIYPYIYIYIHIYPYIYHYLQYKYIWYMFSGPNIPETLSSRETLLAEVAAICIKYPPCTAPWSLQNSLEKTGLGCVYVGLMLGPFGSHIHPYSVYLLFKTLYRHKYGDRSPHIYTYIQYTCFLKPFRGTKMHTQFIL